MAINMVECGSCGEVIDAANRVCPHCGAQLQRAAGAPSSGSFAERYRGTEYEYIPPAVAAPARRSSPSALLVAIGVALVVVVAGIGAMWALQPGAAAPTDQPRVYAPTPTPTPAPTLPPQVSLAMQQLKDPEFSARIKVQTRASWSSEVVGTSASVVTVLLDATVSSANVSGKVTVGQIGYEFRVVDGQSYQRVLPSGKWSAIATLIPQARVLPLFDLSDAKQLTLVGDETLDGKAVHHLRSTDWWNPDVARVALLENLIGVTPQTVVLDLYVGMDGAPVRADYNVQTKAKSGKDIMTIATRYDFTDVGKAVKIPSPIASPSKK